MWIYTRRACKSGPLWKFQRDNIQTLLLPATTVACLLHFRNRYVKTRYGSCCHRHNQAIFFFFNSTCVAKCIVSIVISKETRSPNADYSTLTHFIWIISKHQWQISSKALQKMMLDFPSLFDVATKIAIALEVFSKDMAYLLDDDDDVSM